MASNLFAASTVNNKYYKYSGFSSTILSSLSQTNAIAIAYNGTDIVYNFQTTSMKKGTGFGLTVQSSFTLPAALSLTYDVDFDSSFNLLACGDSSKYYKLSGFSATVTTSFTKLANFRGVGTDNTNALGTNLPGANFSAYKFSGYTSTVTTSFTGTNSSRGITWDGTNVIWVQNSSAAGGVKKYSGFSSTVSSSFTPVGDAFGIAWGTDAVTASTARPLSLLGAGA